MAEQNQTLTTHKTIYLMLLIVVILWGANVVMIKYLTGFFTPTALAALRLSTAALVLVPVVLWRHGWVKLSHQDWLSITGIAMFCITLHQLALSWGLVQTSGTHAVLILSLNPLVTSILAASFADEPFTWYKTLGIILGFSGILLIVSPNGNFSSPGVHGDILIFIAMLLYVLGSLLIKKTTASVPPLVVTAYSHTIGAIGLVLIALCTTPVWLKGPAPNVITASVFLCSAFFATALGAFWWNTAIQKIGASSTSLFLNISPIAGIFTASFYLHEMLYWQHFVSLLLVITGVGLGTGILQRIQR